MPPLLQFKFDTALNADDKARIKAHMPDIVSPFAINAQADTSNHLIRARIDDSFILVFPLDHLALIRISRASWI